MARPLDCEFLCGTSVLDARRRAERVKVGVRVLLWIQRVACNVDGVFTARETVDGRDAGWVGKCGTGDCKSTTVSQPKSLPGWMRCAALYSSFSVGKARGHGAAGEATAARNGRCTNRRRASARDRLAALSLLDARLIRAIHKYDSHPPTSLSRADRRCCGSSSWQGCRHILASREPIGSVAARHMRQDFVLLQLFHPYCAYILLVPETCHSELLHPPGPAGRDGF